jgi:hypothetical protein
MPVRPRREPDAAEHPDLLADEHARRDPERDGAKSAPGVSPASDTAAWAKPKTGRIP